jgi:large repetitive protein
MIGIAQRAARRSFFLLFAGLLAAATCICQAQPLRIATLTPPSATVGVLYSQALSATGGKTPYSWSVSAGSLPTGLALSSSGSISGTPANNGMSTFTAQVQDTQGRTDALALQIPVVTNPVITTSTLPNGTAGSSYSATLAATGAVSPVTWSLSQGTLPQGLSLAASTGVISGTPAAPGTSAFTVKLADSGGGTATKALSLTVKPAPLAITTASLPAGTVGTAYSQALAASGGTSPYSWAIASGSLPSGLSLSTGGTISGTPGAAGSSSFTVRVTDSASVTATAPLSLTINPPPLKITTTSLPTGTVGTAYSQALGASGGTPPYSWTLASGSLPAGLNLSTAGTISGTPGTAGLSSFTVRVTDSATVTATAPLSLTINPPPLKITTSSLPAGTVGTPYSQTLGASGGTPPYSWALASGSLPARLGLSAGGTISGTPGNAGLSSFTVRVTDSASVTATAPLSLTIDPDPPVVTTSSLPAGTVGIAYSQALAASGGSPPYNWLLTSGSLPAGLSLSAGGTLSGTPEAAGLSVFTVRVTDSALASGTAALSVSINPSALGITTSSLPAGTVGIAYAQALAASGGTPPYSWALASGSLPAGLNLSAGGTLSGTPGTAGLSSFTVRVTDHASVAATAPLSVSINPPVLRIITSSLPAGTAGTAYSQALAASGGTPPYTWALATGSMPSGLSLSTGGTISGTPSTAGSSTFTVRVTDSASVSATASLTLIINPPALGITTSSLPAGTVGIAYSQALAAAGGMPPYTWAIATGSLPSGLSVSTGGTISGTPNAAGSSSFTVKVTDSASVSATASLTLIVNPPTLGITTSSLPAGTAGIAYSQALAAAGGTPPYTWALATGSLPAGLSLSTGGTISGTPSAAGSSSFTVKVTDSASVAATASLTLIVNPPTLGITTSSLPAGTAGIAYSQALAAAGGTPPYTWALATGSLPAGLSLSTGGTISGTPNAAGSSSFTVRVTDSASVSATAPLSVSINPPALGITTSSLPAGTAGIAYSQALAAAGGTPPYTWALATGSLPAGLSLSPSGTISGTPSTAGSSSFTVRVTDSASVSATAPLSLTINPPSLGITTSSLPAGTAGTAYSQALAAGGGTPPYTWALATGSLPAGLSLSPGGTISGTPSAAGTSSFTVRVTDSASVSATAPLTLIVNPPALGITTSSLPAGTAGTAYSQALAAGGGTPSYTWALATGSLPAGLNLSPGGTISGTPSTAGSSSFTVKVTDSASATATAPLTLIINPPALGITTSSLPAGTAGTAYSQALAAAGGTPPYTWALASGPPPDGLSLSPGGTISGTPSAAGSSTFTVRVTDSASATATAPLTVSINPSALGITTSSLPVGTVGTAYSQALAGAGGTPPYTWALATGSLPTGLSLSPGGTISGTPSAAGTSTFTVRVTDGASATATASLTLAINPPALGITTSSLSSGTVGTAYFQALAATGGTPPYSWALSALSLPAGLSLSATGTISGTPLTTGLIGFSVQVTDSAGNKTTKTLAIDIEPAPVQITTPSLPPSTVGVSYSQTLTATGGSPPFVWSLLSGSPPPGLTLDPAGAIRGTPTIAGSYTFTLQVAEHGGATAKSGLAITINPAVSISTNSVADALIGAPYVQPLRALGGTPPYLWSLTSGALPDGVKLDSSAGSLGGTPTVVGSFSFTLRASDSAHAFAERQFQITTAADLVITTAPILAAATVGLQFAQPLDAAGGRSPYVWSISSGGLPAGVTLNAATGVLSGVPSAAGSFQITVDVSDSLARKASKSFTLPVAAALVISSAPDLPPAIAGASYSQVLAATGGTPPYLWSITSGGLPPGLSFDSGTGTISGVPTQGGSFAFTTQLTDSNSVTASKPFKLAVTSNLTITTASPLPDATVGLAYTRSLSATGGLPPYVWTIKSGSLPPGLALDPATNAITGTPSANGAFAFTSQVSDASGGSATRDYSLAVSLPPLPSVSMDGLSDPANAADQPVFRVSLATSYPVQLTGQIVMTFAADADVPIDDASVQFATGGRTVSFTIPAGSTTSVFSTSQMALQTGTVSGAITLSLSLQSAGGEVTATAARTLHVLRAPPVTRTLQVVHTAGGFELHITGYSTPCQLTQALVQLTPAAGSNLQTTQLTIALADVASSWYRSMSSSTFGSQFTLVLPFAIQGNAAGIDSVSVSLVNNQGASPTVSSKF